VDGIEYFEGKAHSVFEAAAVVVFAPVGQGREKLMQQITVRALELDRIEPEPGGSPCRLHESVTNGGEPAVIEGDRRILAFCEGDGRGRHRLPAAILARPDLPTAFHGVCVDALRPACASWMAIGMSEYRRTVSTTLPSAFSVSADQSPRSSGLILPSGNTAVASMIRSPAPESARLPRWIRCQSVARPSSAEY